MYYYLLLCYYNTDLPANKVMLLYGLTSITQMILLTKFIFGELQDQHRTMLSSNWILHGPQTIFVSSLVAIYVSPDNDVIPLCPYHSTSTAGSHGKQMSTVSFISPLVTARVSWSFGRKAHHCGTSTRLYYF